MSPHHVEETRERASASEPRERSGAWGPRERTSRGAPGGEAPRKMFVPRDGIIQIFVKDPDGLTVELNFPAP
jgi:hypothetical protein